MKNIVLIIEDDNIVRENIKSLLAEEGYDVLSSENGEEGIKIAKEEIPDLIICDIMMPGISGYDVLVELSQFKNTKSIPFIFLTAKVEKENIRKGMNLGADDYLFKPFDADDLLNSISSRLKKIEELKKELAAEVDQNHINKYSIEDKIFIQVNKKSFPISIAEIVIIEAQRQYTTLRLYDGRNFIIRKPISEWESLLPRNKFIRIHRSTIINIDYLTKMETWFNSGFHVYLKTIDQPLTMSRRFASKIKDKLIK